jgi:hypothetical protein
MKWHFSPQLPGQVETEVTQRDQFSNDEVGLAETIVREAIQNSLDAAVQEPADIKVKFRWLDKTNSLSKDFMEEILDQQLLHADAANLNIEDVDFENPTALIIEDFGTKGLTGNTESKDDDNFSDFWRRHGKSHKTGKSRGRWGLGKLVYSTTSQVGVFFGVTITNESPSILLMGQTVLNLRKVDSVEYPPHAFFADIKEKGNLIKEIPVPIQDKGLIEKFTKQFSLERKSETGLSVIIPFPNPEFKFERMIGVAIENYFYPVITGQLILQFNDIEINSNNIRALAHEYADETISDIDELFDFIEEVYIAEEKELLSLKPSWADDVKLDENDIEEKDLETIRDDFASGKLVGLSLPVSINMKDGTTQDSSFSVYIKRPVELTKGLDLYVRGGLTLPSESKFRDRKALGAMIAEKEEICSFLGDAENAAHTKWISTAEKVSRNYKNPQKIVKVIKNSVVELYDLLAEVAEEIDEQALSEFFWMDEPDTTKRKKKPKKTPVIIPKLPEPKIRDFSINQTDGGFTVISTGETTKDRFPQTIRIEMAYNVARGNPFKKYNSFDFTLGGSSGIEVALTKGTGKIINRKENILRVDVMDIPFQLNVSGFDLNRDLRVKLEKEV